MIAWEFFESKYHWSSYNFKFKPKALFEDWRQCKRTHILHKRRLCWEKWWCLECELIFKVVPSGASTWAAQPQTTSSPEWSCWSEWSDCSASCGGPGTRKRNRVCVPGTNNVGSQVCSITLNIFYRFLWLLGIIEIPWGKYNTVFF